MNKELMHTKVVGMRLDPRDVDLFERSASALGYNTAEFIRYAILSSTVDNLRRMSLDDGYSKSAKKYFSFKISEKLHSRLMSLKRDTFPELTKSRFLRSLLKHKINELKLEGMI